MTLSISCQVMDAVAALLQGTAASGHSDIPGVGALFLDAARVASKDDGVVLTLDQGGEAPGVDEAIDTCRVRVDVPFFVEIFVPRVPGDAANWRLLDPFYVAVHARIMANPRNLGGLCRNGGVTSVRRLLLEPDLQACGMRAYYNASILHDQANVTVQR
jgi:hypothetical protein